MNEKNYESIIDLAKIITDSYLSILELCPKDCKHLKYLTESCLLFTSFIAFLHDDQKSQS
jgi:hypothetical protein